MVKKILLIILGIFVLLIAAAIVIPILYKDKIAAKAKESINKTVNAKVDFGAVDLSIIKGFPNIAFCMNDFCITGIAEFEGDTLAFVKELDVRLNLFGVLGGSEMEINSVSLDQPYVQLLVLKDGKANYDIMKEDTTASAASSGSFKASLKSYSIKNGLIIYDDRSADFKLKIEQVDHTGKGDFTQDFFTLDTKTKAEKTSLWYGAMKYISGAKTDLDAAIDVDMKNSKYTFRENLLTLNELPISVDGWIAMPEEDIDMDLKFGIKKSDFSSFVSLIPGVYTSQFKDLKASGQVALDGFVKGTYNENKIPAFAVNLKIDNGMFQYPSLPSSVNNVHVDLGINNPDGIDDHTVIDLKKLHAELGKEPVDARLHVTTPVSDANIDGMVKGTVNLANIRNFIPLEEGTDLSGTVSADVTMKGRYSSIENQKYEDFHADGNLSVTDMKYKSGDYPLTTISRMTLAFNPRNVVLNQFNAKMGSSDFNATGIIDNLLGYYLKDELLKGNFSLNSAFIDLNELMTGQSTASATPDTSSLSIMEVPSNIDFSLAASIGKILYDNLTLQNVKGNISVRNQVLDLSQLAFNMLGGSATMNGTYATTHPGNADIDYKLSLNNFDIQQTVKSFNTVQKLAPIAERCTGNFSSDLSVKGQLDNHMQPVMSSLSGAGSLVSNNVQVSNFEPLNQLASALKMEEYKKLNLKDVHLSFNFQNGRVNVKPFTNEWNGATATVSGSNGFDRTIDYKVNLAIPKSKIPASAASAFTSALSKANNLTGSNFQLPDPVKVNVLIGGTVDKPAVKTDFSSQGQALIESVREEIKEHVEEQIDAAKQQAKEEADKILAEAEKEAQAIRDAAQASADKVKKEGYAAADKMVKDATNPIAKAAAEQAAKKAKQETDKKAQQIIDEGNRKAQAVLDEAKKKSDALLQ